MRASPHLVLVAAIAATACSTSHLAPASGADVGNIIPVGDAGPDVDAGQTDAGAPNAATADAGEPADAAVAADAGESDAGAETDAGVARGYFPPAAVWSSDVSAAPVDSESPTVIQWLSNAGGWGLGRLQIDFSFNVLEADGSTPKVTFRESSTYYRPDCDDPTPVPLPAGGAIEGEAGYQCTSGADCHLIVVDRPAGRLYEVYQASYASGALTGQCLVVWDLNRVYPPSGRGEQCTSTDAAGFPVAPLLFTADEVASGEIRHAIRFILPNARMRARTYVHPATHAGAPSGPASAPPYGARFRLRADYPVENLPSAGAKVIARALQKYGMLLADGGNVALTAASDRFTRAKWTELLGGSRDLEALQVTDFEMVEAGPRIALTYDCVRNAF